MSFDPAQMVADGSTVPLAPDGRVRTAAACVERMPLEAGFDTGFAVGERHGLRFVRVGSR